MKKVFDIAVSSVAEVGDCKRRRSETAATGRALVIRIRLAPKAQQSLG